MMPYALVLGGEAVLPLELEIPSLHIAMHEELTNDERIKLRMQELESQRKVTHCSAEPRTLPSTNAKII